MKTNTGRKFIIWIVNLFLLVSSEVATLQASETPESHLQPTSIPQRPEKLLSYLNFFIKKGDEDAVLLAERLTGINKNEWGNGFEIKNTGVQIYSPYVLKSKYGGFQGTKLQEDNTPYKLREIRFEFKEAGDPLRLFFAIREPKEFLLSPELTSEILGTPTSILVDVERYLGSYPRILYCYETARYQVHIWFKDDSFQAIPTPGTSHPEDYLQTIENHRNFYGYKILIERKKFPGNYSDLARKFVFTPPASSSDLLALLKNFSTIPDGEQYWQFAEKIFGLPVAQWGIRSYGHSTASREFVPYDYVGSYDGIYRPIHSTPSLYGILRAGGYNPPPSPYSSTRLIVDDVDKNVCFRELGLVFDDTPESFCLTPLETRKILGLPSGFLVEVAQSRRNFQGKGMAKIHYTYETSGYEIKIQFEDREHGYGFPKLKSGQQPLSVNEINQRKVALVPLTAHQSYCGDQLRIQRKKFLRNYNEWAHSFKIIPPKTGLELLTLLAELAKPSENRRKLIERLSGISPAAWGEPFHVDKKPGREVAKFCPSCKNAPYGILKEGGYNPPPLPYRSDFWVINKNQLLHADFTIPHDSANYKISPNEVRSIFGEPLNIFIRKPKGYKLIVYGDSNRFSVVYKYQVGIYEMKVIFPIAPSRVEEFKAGFTGRKKARKNFLREYHNHDELTAFIIEIKTPK